LHLQLRWQKNAKASKDKSSKGGDHKSSCVQLFSKLLLKKTLAKFLSCLMMINKEQKTADFQGVYEVFVQIKTFTSYIYIGCCVFCSTWRDCKKILIQKLFHRCF